jgi:hypothetical protein
MATDVQDHTIEEKIAKLRELFADAPDVGKQALENALKELTSQGPRHRRRRSRAPAGSAPAWARSRS